MVGREGRDRVGGGGMERVGRGGRNLVWRGGRESGDRVWKIVKNGYREGSGEMGTTIERKWRTEE